MPLSREFLRWKQIYQPSLRSILLVTIISYECLHWGVSSADKIHSQNWEVSYVQAINWYGMPGMLHKKLLSPGHKNYSEYLLSRCRKRKNVKNSSPLFRHRLNKYCNIILDRWHTLFFNKSIFQRTIRGHNITCKDDANFFS